MAKAERKSNPFGWIVLGALVGAVAVAGVLLAAASMNVGQDQDHDAEPARITVTPDSEADPAPVAAAPPGSEQPAPPAEAAPAPPTPPAQPSVDAQMADDAAAAGMTSRAPAEPQPAN